MKGIALVLIGLSGSSVAAADANIVAVPAAKSDFEHKGRHGAHMLATIFSVVETAVPDFGISYRGDPLLTFEPVVLLSPQWSASAGVTFAPRDPRPTSFFAQASYRIGKPFATGVDVGAGGFINVEGEAGPRMSVEFKGTVHSLLRVGIGTSAQYNVPTERVEGRVYLKLELPFALWNGV